ncbi:MAG TPA: ribosome biogenesis GTP-binding protein YihA/YsxC [Bryobacteraceae bacterium]|nr:ribosome biogenesis GTP-binding protein YihA/YsxC [Bryobacteraceae bacterium]
MLRQGMEAEHIISAASPEQFPAEELPEVAFLGRSNVGKSSLLNSLVGKKGLAFTSAKPGCTQLINFYRIDGSCHFVDLPGYGFAKVPAEVKARWKSLIESYLFNRKTLQLAVVLLDARRGWMEKDLELKRWLEFQGLPYLVVATKIDKLNQKEEHRGLRAIQKEILGGELVPFSAVTGRGAREIWQAIWKTKTKQ